MENNNLSNAIFVMDYRNEENDCEDGHSLTELPTVERVNAAKRKRITSEQLSKLKSFNETHSDFTKDTNKGDCVQELDWECLVVELNVIGPPVHTSKEWRTVWSQYKANKKRKMVTKQLDLNVVQNQPCLESCSHEITVETDDPTPNVGVFEGDLKDDKSDCMDKLFQKVVDLENKIDSSETKIMESLEELKTLITEKFSSV